MTYEQEKATELMLKLLKARDDLRLAAVELKALHWQEITGYQREIVSLSYAFVYADTVKGFKITEASNGRFWRYDKFIMLARVDTSPSYEKPQEKP